MNDNNLIIALLFELEITTKGNFVTVDLPFIMRNTGNNIANVLDDYSDIAAFYNYEIREGSIIRRIKVFTSISLILLAIERYGGVREGVDYIIKDANAAAKAIFKKTAETESLTIDDVENISRHPGFVEKIIGIYNQVEKLENDSYDISPKEINARIRKLKKEIDDIIKITQGRGSKLFSELPAKYTISRRSRTSEDKSDNRESRRTTIGKTYFIRPTDEIFKFLHPVRRNRKSL